MVEVYRKDLATSYTVENDWVKNEDGVEEFRDLQWYRDRGYDTDSSVQGTAEYSGTTNNEDVDAGIDFQYAMSIANTLYNYLPEQIVKAYAQGYVNYGGNKELALAYTRGTKEYQDTFSYLIRDDGSLRMSELEAMSNIESFKSTLAEVGITDFTEFQDEFEEMIGGHETGSPVSPLEFQQRIDLVYNNVIDRIPEVKRLFAEEYGIDTDNATIFASLINPKIEDKVLKGTIATVNIAAEATSRGFTYSFDKFNRLKLLGMNIETAAKVYESAGSLIEQAKGVGRNLELSTIEEAALGDVKSSERLTRITGEIESQSGIRAGARKKDDKVTGLLES